jgi:predicted RNase H-like nuclease (RuvC/YqgF family)
MSYYENRIKELEHRIEQMARANRLKAIPVEAQLIDRIAELNKENARLKAEVERLKIDAYKKLSMRIEIDKLKAQIEYLTNAGNGMANAINGDYNHELPCVKAWNAAKEGKPSV